MSSALVILPPGAEEVEFVGSVDLLRRAGVSIFIKMMIFSHVLFVIDLTKIYFNRLL